MDAAHRQKLINGLVLGATILAVLLGLVRFITFVGRQGTPNDQPIRLLPTIFGTWDAPGKVLECTKDFRKLEIGFANFAYERTFDGGPREKGFALEVPGTWKNEAPTGGSGEVILVAFENEQPIRREPIRYRVHNDSLHVWDATGNETIFAWRK